MTDQPPPSSAPNPAPTPAQSQAAPPAGEDDVRARWLAALLEWDRLRTQLGDVPATYLAAATDLKRARRDDAADLVMGEAVRRFSDNLDLAVRHATAAQSREAWDVALERWQWLVARFPGNAIGYIGAGRLLRRDPARLAEAETLLELAAARFPFRQDVWVEYAAVAYDRKDRAAALQRYQAMRERFPDLATAHRWTATVLREEQRFDEADAVLAEAMDRFPDDRQWLVDRAWVAHMRQDWEESVRRWAEVRAADPKNLASHWLPGAALMNGLGRFEEAEALLAQGVALFPDHVELASDHARVAERLEDWPEAERRWSALARRRPTDAALAAEAARVRRRVAAG